jgi:hypothetical protein
VTCGRLLSTVTRSLFRSLLGVLATTGLVLQSGCAGLQLTPIQLTQQNPSNVALYFQARTGSGDPASGIAAEQFRIYEDSHLVSLDESKQTLLNPDLFAAYYTILLVDVSGDATDDPMAEAIGQAANAFAARIDKVQKLSVYAFDGGPDLYPIVSFFDSPESAESKARSLASFKPKDPSSNLNGAIVGALAELDDALGKASQPLRFGTLVVFAAGADRAGRVSTDSMLQRVRSKPYDIFAIGLGPKITDEQLRSIATSGRAMAADKTFLGKAFDDVAAKVEGGSKSYYLLSYCSPSRAGKHEVRVEATVVDPKTKGEQTGSLRGDFDATGFGPGCDPKTPPAFDAIQAGGPAATTEHGDKNKEEMKKEELKKESPRKEEKKQETKGEKKPAARVVVRPAPTPQAPALPTPRPPPVSPLPAPAPPPPPPAAPDFNP